MILYSLKKHDYTLHVLNNSRTEILPLIAVMSTTQVAEIQLQPSRPADYSAYVPVKLGNLTTAAFVDSGDTFANVISPETMTALGISTAQLEPVPQLSVGTAAAGKRMKILGQAPRIDLQLGQHPAKFRISPPGSARSGTPGQPLWPLLSSCQHRPNPFQGSSAGSVARRYRCVPHNYHQG